MVKSKLKYKTKIMLFGIFDLGVESYTFSSLEDAKKSKDLILKSVRAPFRCVCRVKLVPIY